MHACVHAKWIRMHDCGADRLHVRHKMDWMRWIVLLQWTHQESATSQGPRRSAAYEAWHTATDLPVQRDSSGRICTPSYNSKQVKR